MVKYTKEVTIIIKFIKNLLRRSRAKHKPIDANYIIPRTQHNVSKSNININALKVLNRLNSSGFQAYLVGGSVRDLLLNKHPKDFDVATNATPNQIKKLFRNARIIGRRFKLVHILFGREVIEVATFRGSDDNTESINQITNERGMLVRDNVYGTLHDDVWRRDFTINALYYNLEDSSIIDFTGGVKDVHQGVLRLLGDALVRYQEDPVRMLRAIRFSAKLHFTLAAETAAPLATQGHLLTDISSSRLFDEITKLTQCGEVERAFHLMIEYGLFAHLFSQTNSLLAGKYPVKAMIDLALQNTDARIRDNKPITPSYFFAVILWFPLQARATELQQRENLPPLAALEKAMTDVIIEQNRVIAVPKRFTQMMREIWLLQYRFQKRSGNRAYHLLQHPRFRAAFDFLALRSLAGDERVELAEWWTTFQDASEEVQQAMIQKVSKNKPSPKQKPNTPKE